jgi:hypothetical protein
MGWGMQESRAAQMGERLPTKHEFKPLYYQNIIIIIIIIIESAGKGTKSHVPGLPSPVRGRDQGCHPYGTGTSGLLWASFVLRADLTGLWVRRGRVE